MQEQAEQFNLRRWQIILVVALFLEILLFYAIGQYYS